MGCVETEACFSSDSLGQSSFVEVKNQTVMWSEDRSVPAANGKTLGNVGVHLPRHYSQTKSKVLISSENVRTVFLFVLLNWIPNSSKLNWHFKLDVIFRSFYHTGDSKIQRREPQAVLLNCF